MTFRYAVQWKKKTRRHAPNWHGIGWKREVRRRLFASRNLDKKSHYPFKTTKYLPKKVEMKRVCVCVTQVAPRGGPDASQPSRPSPNGMNWIRTHLGWASEVRCHPGRRLSPPPKRPAHRVLDVEESRRTPTLSRIRPKKQSLVRRSVFSRRESP